MPASSPLAAVVDVWALAFQGLHYVEDGAGRDSFGPQQQMAREGARQMLADADATIRRIAVILLTATALAVVVYRLTIGRRRISTPA